MKFSICILTYNKTELLKKAIASAIRQDFDDYEVIISNNGSTDDTENIILSFNDPKIKYIKHQNTVPMVENWNTPLREASGEYIAYLHDDDEYEPNHLKEAWRILSENKNIGVYAANNQMDRCPIIGLMKSKPYFQYIYTMERASNPTQTIFKREHKGKKYFYNEDYDCCPEVELYLNIADDGHDAYFNDSQTVRKGLPEFSGTNKILYTWTMWVDVFKILKKYKDHQYIGQKEYLDVLNIQLNKAFFAYLRGKIGKRKGADEIFENIKRIAKENFKHKHQQLVFLKVVGDFLTKFSLLSMEDLKIFKKVYYLSKKYV